MRSLIIYHAGQHRNTEKIAKAMSEVLGADCKRTHEVLPSAILEYDLVGFGSGIYFGRHHAVLLSFVKELVPYNKDFFIFSTSGMGGVKFHEHLKNKLSKKGYEFIGEFACKGFDTFGPFKLIGGLNKGRPNNLDLENAKKFASTLKNR
jgi:flavodoxin